MESLRKKINSRHLRDDPQAVKKIADQFMRKLADKLVPIDK